MSANDATEVVGAIGVFVLVTAVLVVTIWQVAATVRARAALAREREYRDLAEKAALAQTSTERLLADMAGRLAEMQTRMQSLERILKEVE